MAKARYYKADGKKGKARELPEALFDGVVNKDVMHQAVKAYLANQRQGTGSAKNRSAVRGGSRKPWRQKGTGRARQGTIRAAQWAGGGRAFPPIPHSWRQKLPRRVKLLARRSAFNVRAEDDRVILVDLPTLDAPKTREMKAFFASFEAAEDKVLLLTDGLNETIHLSVRNMPKVQIMPFGQESVYDLLWADTVVVEKSAMDAVADEAPAKKKKAEPAAEKKKAPKKKKAAAKAEKKDEAEAPEAEAAEETPEAEAAVETEAPAEEEVADDEPAAEAEEAEAADEESDEAADAEDDEEKTDA